MYGDTLNYAEHLKNPTVIRMPRERRHPVRTRISYMNGEQLDRFLAAAKEYGQREHAMFLVAFAHGLRTQEIANLRIKDINLKTEQIHIANEGLLDSLQSMTKVKGNPLRNEVAVLREWLAVRPIDADDFVFNSQKSTQMLRTSIHRLFKAIARKAGLPDALQHPHTLKHSLAMAMVNGGANAFLIKQQMGHKSFDSTLAYVNPSDADASKAAALAIAKF